MSFTRRAATTIAATTLAAASTFLAPSTAEASVSLPRCTSAALRITIGGGSGGAAGSVFTAVNFVNRSHRTCYLFGHPGVSFVAGDDGHQIGAAARRDKSSIRVVLRPGARAHATLRVVDYQVYSRAFCRPVPVRGYRIYAPGETDAVFVSARSSACSNVGAHQLSVDAVQAGPPTD